MANILPPPGAQLPPSQGPRGGNVPVTPPPSYAPVIDLNLNKSNIITPPLNSFNPVFNLKIILKIFVHQGTILHNEAAKLKTKRDSAAHCILGITSSFCFNLQPTRKFDYQK